MEYHLKEKLTVTLDEDVLETLKKLALQERMSVSAYLNKLLFDLFCKKKE